MTGVRESLSFCIFSGYPRESREDFDRSDVGHPHDFYRDFLGRHVPEASVEVLFVADTTTSLPAGAELSSYDGFLWTGSDLTIYHDDERVKRQIELAQAAFEAGVPSFGSCWGVQMAAVAAGGEVRKSPKGREWGIAREIRRADDEKPHPLLAGKPDRYDGFIMHLDEVTRLPSGARLLASNEHTKVQALEVRHRKGVFWATQYHPEYNLLEMARLIKARAEPLVKEGFFEEEAGAVEHADKMRALHGSPGDEELREELGIGEDILDPAIREAELRNWVDRLVLPSRSRASAPDRG